jgi:hypothetical protein
MVFPVQPSDEGAKRQMAVNGFASIKESEVAAIENKDYDIVLHLCTQVYVRGISTSSP